MSNTFSMWEPPCVGTTPCGNPPVREPPCEVIIRQTLESISIETETYFPIGSLETCVDSFPSICDCAFVSSDQIGMKNHGTMISYLFFNGDGQCVQLSMSNADAAAISLASDELKLKI